jgi:hypothetical protein
MINIRTLRKIENNGGLTLKDGKIINYKSGYQVATEGETTTDITKVRSIMKRYNGNCGLWLENGIWYIDKSKRISTKKKALALGRECNQISIFKWANYSLIYC